MTSLVIITFFFVWLKRRFLLQQYQSIFLYFSIALCKSLKQIELILWDKYSFSIHTSILKRIPKLTQGSILWTYKINFKICLHFNVSRLLTAVAESHLNKSRNYFLKVIEYMYVTPVPKGKRIDNKIPYKYPKKIFLWHNHFNILSYIFFISSFLISTKV